MIRPCRVAPCLLTLLVAACDAGSAPDGGAVEPAVAADVLEAALESTGGAVLGFTADWRVDLGDEPLMAGARVHVVYDPARLPQCRGRKYGLEAWSLLVYWRGPDGTERYTSLVRGTDGLHRADVPIAEGAAVLELWFANNDIWGCQAWDSDYGRNFRFPVVPASGRATITFAGDAAGALDGRLVQRGLVSIRYDAQRLAACAHDEGGLRAWNGTAAWRFLPGGQRGEAPLFQPWSSSTLALPELPLQIPSDATALELWFRGADPFGCETWDSRDGANHRFEVGPAVDDLAIGWAGAWNTWRGHDCHVVEGLEDPVRFERSGAGHDCMAIGVRVWVPGLTDRDGAPTTWIRAEVVTDLGLGERLAVPAAFPLTYDGRVGNDHRFRWDLGQRVAMGARGDYRFHVRVSIDGATWVEVGQGQDPGGAARTLQVRDDSLDR